MSQVKAGIANVAGIHEGEFWNSRNGYPMCTPCNSSQCASKYLESPALFLSQQLSILLVRVHHVLHHAALSLARSPNVTERLNNCLVSGSQKAADGLLKQQPAMSYADEANELVTKCRVE